MTEEARAVDDDADAAPAKAVELPEWQTRPLKRHTLVDMMVGAQANGIGLLARRDAQIAVGNTEYADALDEAADLAFAQAKVFELASFDEKGFRAFCVRAKSGKRSAS